jgi:hypothetical protein
MQMCKSSQVGILSWPFDHTQDRPGWNTTVYTPCWASDGVEEILHTRTMVGETDLLKRLGCQPAVPFTAVGKPLVFVSRLC